MPSYVYATAGILGGKFGGTPAKTYSFSEAGLPSEINPVEYINYSFTTSGPVFQDVSGRYSVGSNISSVSSGPIQPELESGVINGLSEFSYGESELFLSSGNAPMVSSYFSYGESDVLHYFRTYAEGCEYDTELSYVVFAYNSHQASIGAAYFPPVGSLLFNENSHNIYTGASYSNILSLYQYVQNEHLAAGGATYKPSAALLEYATQQQSVNIGAAYYPSLSNLEYGANTQGVYTGASYANISGIILFVPFDHQLWACRHPDFYTAPVRPVGSYTPPDRVTGEGYSAPARPEGSYRAPRRHGSRFCYPI